MLERLRALFFRREHDAELDEELRYHLEREIERNIANGMSPADARDAARRAFGNVTVATEQARDASRWRLLEETRQDVLYAIRTFRRAPIFVAGVIATIGLGLGLLSSAFTFFDAYVLRPLAVRDPASLYDITWIAAIGDSHRFTSEQYARLSATRGFFSETFAYSMVQARVRGRPAIGQFVSGNYFSMLGVPPALGRTLLVSDDDPGAPQPVVVLSHHLWRTVFGADSSVIGQRVSLNGTPLTIVGVARAGFGGLTSSPYDFWAPLAIAPTVQSVPSRFRSLGSNGLSVIARLSPNVSVERARSMFTAWMIAETQGGAQREQARGAAFTPRGTSMPHDTEVIAMFAPVIIAFLLVMLIACANVANLMLARGMARQREIGIRLTLGAGRSRLIRQLLTEALMLALPAGLLGFVISRVAIATSLSMLFATVPTAYASYIRVIPLDADLRIVGFMLCAAVTAAVAFGLVPALQATRPDVVRASRGDFETAMRPSRLRNVLVVAQVTMSVLLLVLAGVLLASSRRTERLDPGMRTAAVVQVEMLPRFRARGIEVLKEEPIVRRLASSTSTALDGAYNQANAAPLGKPSQRVFFNIVSPGWFDVLELPIERGRAFTEDEGLARAPVAVVSRSAAAALWPGQDPVGQTLTIPENARVDGRLASYRTARVVGVTKDVSPGSIAIDPRMPVVYYPQPLDAGDTQFIARVSGDPEAARQAVEQAIVTKVDSSAAVETHTLATSLALQVYPFRAVYWIAAAIGAIALVLTLIGVYGVMSYLVAQRRKEFGIRLALGARSDGLIALVLRQSMRMASIGVTIGVALALGVSKLLDAILYNVDMFNLGGYLAGVMVVAGTCLVAAYVPSRRAAAVNPVEALRAD
jgi:predicted permease